MPIYEYQCKSCHSRFEKLVRTMTAPEPAATCPDCGSHQTTRALSVFAVGADASPSRSSGNAPPTCGRCGGPGPCALD